MRRIAPDGACVPKRPLSGDPATIPWPDGDLVKDAPLPANVDAAALQAASDWAFDRPTPEQVTLSLIVIQDGRLIHERYAPGVHMDTRTRTWSTAKSIAGTLIGILVDQGKMHLDEPLGFEWLPKARSPETDPRNGITLGNVLNMSSGLYPSTMEHASGHRSFRWLHPQQPGLHQRPGPGAFRHALEEGDVRRPRASTARRAQAAWRSWSPRAPR